MTDTDQSRREFAREYLRMANESYIQTKAKRAYFAHLARKHDMTIQEIADSYGVVPGTIRYLLANTDPATGYDLPSTKAQGASGAATASEGV